MTKISFYKNIKEKENDLITTGTLETKTETAFDAVSDDGEFFGDLPIELLETEK